MLEGKVALETGAAQDLGREAARIFDREGARVIVVDSKRENGHTLVVDGGVTAGVMDFE